MKVSPSNQLNNFLSILVILLILALKSSCASFNPLQPLIEQKFTDRPSVIRLAQDEKFSIPLNGRYISYEIKEFPQKSNDCVFKQPAVQYKKLAESNKLFDQNDEIISMLVLKRSQKIILADPYFNILVYSTDQHKLLRPLSPKTSLLSHTQPVNNILKTVSSVSMIKTQQQDYVYYLSPNNSFVFAVKSLGSQIQKLSIELPLNIRKAIYHKGYVVFISEDEGIFVYKLDKKQHTMIKVQNIKKQHYHQYIDVELDAGNQIFYVLTEQSIEVYLFKPAQFPNPESHEFTILIEHDQINLSNYTRNPYHIQNTENENNVHLNLEVSSINPKQNEIFVLFRHDMRQNVIGEFFYEPIKKQLTFLRYFKFQMQIKEIHIIEDVIVVVGNEILGMFPYGVDPRLIKEEFNGWITMSDIQKIRITEAPYFVGVTKNSIQFGGLMFQQETGLNCKFSQKSQTKSIEFTANLTWCNSDLDRFYHKYCSYSKKFIIESMDIVTTSMISSSVWIIMLVSILCIIAGIFIMLIMHKRKEKQIKRLQLYFEEKRRTEIPASSDRR